MIDPNEPKPRVDFILYNATIYTVDSNFSIQHAMVIDDGHIIACGSNDLVKNYQADSVWNANGLFIYPGFIDAHCHFSGYAMSKSQISLAACNTWKEVVSALKRGEKKNLTTWIQARQWDETRSKDGLLVTKEALDREFPDIPVSIMRIDGHSMLCNSKALDKAGITVQSLINGKKPEQRDGQLTGWVRDELMEELLNHIPEPGEEEALDYLRETEIEFFKEGVTSFVDCMVENSWMHHVMKAYEEHRIQIHGNYVLTSSSKNLNEFLSKGKINTQAYSICGFKVFADGTLGSKSAAMLENYEHSKGKGQLIVSRDSLMHLAQQIYASDFQLMVHAIGDSSNRMVLQGLSNILKDKNNRRWRLEHAQVVKAQDKHLFGEYSIIPSVQPSHALSDMRWLYDRIGKLRGKDAYAYQDLLNENGWLALGTDFPVEPLNPIRTFCAAVFRKNEKNEPKGGFQMENALSRKDALRGMTIWAARSVFDDKLRGSLENGKVANFVVLPIDLMKADIGPLYSSHIIRTYVNGISQ